MSIWDDPDDDAREKAWINCNPTEDGECTEFGIGDTVIIKDEE